MWRREGFLRIVGEGDINYFQAFTKNSISPSLFYDMFFRILKVDVCTVAKVKEGEDRRRKRLGKSESLIDFSIFLAEEVVRN